MTIQLDTKTLRPATMAAIIADMLDDAQFDAATISKLVTAIEISVGDEIAIEFLAAAGVTPEMLEGVATL